MENIIKTNNEEDKIQKNDNNENKEISKILNNIQENINEEEKLKEEFKHNKEIDFNKNNSILINDIFKSNNFQTSFPLLFK